MDLEELITRGLNQSRKVYSDRDRCTMLEGSALEGEWTKQLPKHDMNIVVMEGDLINLPPTTRLFKNMANCLSLGFLSIFHRCLSSLFFESSLKPAL